MVDPIVHAPSFTCPLCNIYSKMDWRLERHLEDNYCLMVAQCQHCNRENIWRVKKNADTSDAKMLYPDVSITVMPTADMPENVKSDFLEAKSIFKKSPKAAAALLRLALQKLCIFLGEPGKNINNDIKSLSEKGVLSPMVTKAADTVRITGNNAVHPGEMNEQDVDYIAAKMFDLINFIVKKTITEPKELEEIYSSTPESARKAIEKRDTK